jgi:hypothetical protein
MKLRHSLIIILLLLVAGGAYMAISQEKTTRPVVVKGYAGRYQLFHGSFYERRDKVYERTGVFKIDTITGDSWIYREGLDSRGEFYSRWVEISDR